MYIYKVFIGISPNVIHDTVIVKAKSCADAEKKALKDSRRTYGNEFHVVKVEELADRLVE